MFSGCPSVCACVRTCVSGRMNSLLRPAACRRVLQFYCIYRLLGKKISSCRRSCISQSCRSNDIACNYKHADSGRDIGSTASNDVASNYNRHDSRRDNGATTVRSGRRWHESDRHWENVDHAQCDSRLLRSLQERSYYPQVPVFMLFMPSAHIHNTIQCNTKFAKRHVAVASEALANRTVKKHRRRRTNVL